MNTCTFCVRSVRDANISQTSKDIYIIADVKKSNCNNLRQSLYFKFDFRFDTANLIIQEIKELHNNEVILKNDLMIRLICQNGRFHSISDV